VERGADVSAASNLGHSVLELAAMSDGSSEIVRLLLARGADPKAVDKVKMSTLHAATLGNDTETIRQLVATGVEVNSADLLTGSTPLMNAAQNGNLEAVKLLLSKGANPNAVSAPPGPTGAVKNGIIQLGQFTPLFLASTFGPLDIVKTLLAAGANVNVKDARGLTPLMVSIATDHGDVNIAKTLLAAGADVNAKSLTGETALDCAQKSGATPIVAELTRANAIGTPMAAHEIPDPAPTAMKPAVTRGMELLERGTGTFFVNGACGACHAQNVTDFAAMSLRKQGIAINDAAAAQRAAGAAAVFGSTASGLLERVDGPAVDDRIRRAMTWLQSTTPRTTEDLSFRLMGLAWGGANADTVRRVATDLAAKQRADGGWSQRDEMTSDAYATGLAVYALRESGARPATGTQIQKGAKYLLSTQRTDGSWYVRSRSPKFQPYFEGGFPYGHDQWISSMATGWATAALAATQETTTTAQQ
jgi:ankyrin repeat protein